MVLQDLEEAVVGAVNAATRLDEVVGIGTVLRIVLPLLIKVAVLELDTGTLFVTATGLEPALLATAPLDTDVLEPTGGFEAAATAEERVLVIVVPLAVMTVVLQGVKRTGTAEEMVLVIVLPLEVTTIVLQGVEMADTAEESVLVIVFPLVVMMVVLQGVEATAGEVADIEGETVEITFLPSLVIVSTLQLVQ